jgi:hypothetical protein
MDAWAAGASIGEPSASGLPIVGLSIGRRAALAVVKKIRCITISKNKTIVGK